MHSRIMGVMPLDEYNKYYPDEPPELYYEETPSFADYYSEDTDLNEDFLWLLEVLSKTSNRPELIEVDDKELTLKFKSGFKEAFFRKSWEEIVKTVLSSESFEGFCGLARPGGYSISYKLKKLIDDHTGFYMADEHSCYETLDSWVRYLDYDKTYKIFDSLDYHG